jgi:hypothetical protein
MNNNRQFSCSLKPTSLMKVARRTLQGRNVMCIAALACLVTAALPALAVNPEQVARSLTNTHHTGLCCSLWGNTVYVHETDKASPVIVTWATDYLSLNTADIYVGISLNSGPCTAYGPREFPSLSLTAYENASYQWVIYPADGLVGGVTNSFQLCGGGANSSAASVDIGFNTLAVQIGN